MRIKILGGANIGRRANFISFEKGFNFLSDCGVEIVPNDLLIPDFSNLPPEFSGIVVLTHAHLDHSGGLPYLYRIFGNRLRIYCTPPTKDLAGILLRDSAKLSREKGYTIVVEEEEVDEIMNCFITVPFREEVEIGSDVTLRFFRAGHILGAASAYIKGPGEDIMDGGDFCTFDQTLIKGAELTPYEPEVFLCEGTYAGRTHPLREAEKHRFIGAILETYQKGGTVLLPSYTVGRAQENAQIIADAKRAGFLPANLPVLIDGMARDVTRVYEKYTDELNWDHLSDDPAARLLAQDPTQPKHLFGDITFVEGKWERGILINDSRPKVIIAGSGTLEGGFSPMYAGRLIDREENAILITGYQFPGSTGRYLTISPPGGQVYINGEAQQINCKVGSFDFSAHSDGAEIIDHVVALGAKQVVLVHGEAEGRQLLAEELTSRGIRPYVPSDLEEVVIAPPIPITD
ncbi:MAG: hypothetical protein A2Y57_02615 [Candidatus Woykebacteria bacterium RBG_13_40_7b]|uniref:MBL fold metallo-hydrolase n=1 Tax=Candidatus Woykebacteria bacterium RBG_13_40_7b TaxID=1802594 RepID=A0A1G1WBH2_9BACT|nr:MAG: hypothetical protein A2Y57_02615 [Candidatus Woykebacteria bacterium RBG_13_40_7b]